MYSEPKRLDCGHVPSPHDEHTTGYGKDSLGKTLCYACAGERDKETMRTTGKIVLYLSADPMTGKYKVTNWPSSLVIEQVSVKEGRHNIAGTRKDIWFMFEGAQWHGVMCGEYTQLVHCRRTKEKKARKTRQ